MHYFLGGISDNQIIEMDYNTHVWPPMLSLQHITNLQYLLKVVAVDIMMWRLTAQVKGGHSVFTS
jgi:hypothetical protein